MKKVLFILTTVLLFAGAFTMKAQDKSNDYFVGKWDVTMFNLPDGDTTMIMTLTRTDGKLDGFFVPTNGEKKDPIKITSVEENTNNKGEITLYFTAQDYDLNLLLNKVDEDNAKGSLVGMFDVKTKRIKE